MRRRTSLCTSSPWMSATSSGTDAAPPADSKVPTGPCLVHSRRVRVSLGQSSRRCLVTEPSERRRMRHAGDRRSRRSPSNAVSSSASHRVWSLYHRAGEGTEASASPSFAHHSARSSVGATGSTPWSASARGRVARAGRGRARDVDARRDRATRAWTPIDARASSMTPPEGECEGRVPVPAMCRAASSDQS